MLNTEKKTSIIEGVLLKVKGTLSNVKKYEDHIKSPDHKAEVNEVIQDLTTLKDLFINRIENAKDQLEHNRELMKALEKMASGSNTSLIDYAYFIEHGNDIEEIMKQLYESAERLENVSAKVKKYVVHKSLDKTLNKFNR